MRRVASVLFAAAAIVHCGDDSTSSSTTPDAGTPPPVPPPPPPPPPPVQPPPPTPLPQDSGTDAITVTTQGPVGTIEVDSYDFSNPSVQGGWSMLASFSHPADAGYTLTTTQIGPCKVHAYSSAAAPGVDDNGGDITFTQGGTTLATATDPGGGYVVTGGSTSAGLPPGSYHFATTGGVVPSLTADIPAPTKISLVTPDLPDSGPLVVDRKKDLAISWPGLSSGNLVFILFGADGLHDVRCEFTGAANAGTIPKAALAMLPAGSGGASAFSRNGTTIIAGGRPVDVSMTFVAANARDDRKYQAILVDYQ